MKKTIIFATIILAILCGGLYMVHAQYSSTIAQLKQQTIPGQLDKVKKEARELEALQKKFQEKGGQQKLEELYAKSNALKALNGSGFTK